MVIDNRKVNSMPKKIILDVDTGSDDACAIMLAHYAKEIDLQAVCTVKGNQSLANTTRNTLMIKELLKADFPVYKGCDNGFIDSLVYPKLLRTANADAIDENGNKLHIHESFDLEEPKCKPEDKHAVEFYIDYLSNTKEPVTVVMVGPLTNLAVALAIKPEIVDNIEEIVIMGGAWNITNVTLSAEFNIFDDPESALKVLYCGAKITMVPLDATHTAYITSDDEDKLRKINTPASNFAADLIHNRILVHDQAQPLEVKHACALHDPLCIAYLINPDVLEDVRFVHVDVSLFGLTRGQTVVDQRGIQDNRNVHYAFRGNPKLFSDILLERFSNH